jgi:drug/metabolite transporter (DMT)-like permease
MLTSFKGKIIKHMKFRENLGLFYAVLAALAYALMTTFVKLASEVPFEALVFFRNLVCMIFLSPFLIKNKFNIKTKKIKYHSVRAIAGFLSLYFLFYAAKHLFLVDVILLANTAPLFIPIVVLAWMKLKMPLKRTLAILIGFLGIVIVLKPSYNFFNLAGLIALSGGFMIGIADVAIKKMAKTENPNLIMFYFFITSIICSFYPMINSWKTPTNPIMYLYIALVGICGFIYQFFITRAYTYASITKASPLTFVSVILGAFLGWILWQEALSFHHLIGTILIVIAGIYVIMDKEKSIKIESKDDIPIELN